MAENKGCGKERFLSALAQYEMNCYEKYAPYTGEITYSARHIKQIARILNNKPVVNVRTARSFAKYAAVVAIAAATIAGGYVSVDAMHNEFFDIGSVDYSDMPELTLNAEKTEYTVTGIGMLAEGDIVIPASYGGIPITAIGENAFANNNKITSVTISEGIERIEFGAFSACTKLERVMLPESLSEIGADAFWRCLNLREIRFSQGLEKIGDSAFYSCVKLTEISLPESLKVIGTSCFKACTGLQKVVLQEGIEVIGDSAFYNCSKLEEINFPDSLEIIGDEAFFICGNLESVSLNVDSLGYYVFKNCKKLREVELYAQSVGYNAFAGCTALEKVKIDGMEEIPKGAFSGLTSLTDIEIGESVKIIGESAFYKCAALEFVVFHEGLCEIGDDAFRESGLIAAFIPDSVTEIGMYAFADCKALRQVKLPSGLEVIKSGTFSGCNWLTDIELGESVKVICEKAFYACTWLRELELPEGFEHIGEEAFANCTMLKTLCLPESIKFIGKSAFENCLRLDVIKFEGALAQWESVIRYFGLESIAVECRDGIYRRE